MLLLSTAPCVLQEESDLVLNCYLLLGYAVLDVLLALGTWWMMRHYHISVDDDFQEGVRYHYLQASAPACVSACCA